MVGSNYFDSLLDAFSLSFPTSPLSPPLPHPPTTDFSLRINGSSTLCTAPKTYQNGRQPCKSKMVQAKKTATVVFQRGIYKTIMI